MRKALLVALLVGALLVATASAAFAPKRYVPPANPQSISLLR